MQIRFEATGLRALHDKANQFDRVILAGPVRAALTEASAVVQQEMGRHIPRFSGRAARAIRVWVDRRPFPLFARIRPGPLAHLLEFGSKPHFPPYSLTSGSQASIRGARRLRRFVTRRFVLSGRGTDRQRAIDAATFLLARSISRKGTRRQPFVVPAYAAVKHEIGGILDRAAHRIEAHWERPPGVPGSPR